MVKATAPEHAISLGDMKDYVSGKIKDPVRVVLTENFVGTYNAGTKALTQTTPAAVIIDDVTLALGDRVLLTEQTDAKQNGIYTITTLGVASGAAAVLTRAADFDASAKIVSNVMIPVSEGAECHDSTWKLTTDGTITLDSTALAFAVSDSLRTLGAAFTVPGDASTTSWAFTHGFGTLHVAHEIYDSAGSTVEAEFTRTDANNVTVASGVPLGEGNDLTLLVWPVA
jgi:hypothetical protein